VLAQQGAFELVEIIVVDDRSDDAVTADALARVGEYEVVRVLSNTGRRGPAATRNVGIRAAAGDWIAFLDSDDVWLAETLASFAEIAASEPECRWLGADMDKWYEDGHRDSRGGRLAGGRSGPLLRQSGNNGCVRLLRPVEECIDTNLTWTSTTMARRELLLEIGGYNESLIKSEDAHLWIRLAARTDLWFVPKVLGLYRQHEANITAPADPLDNWSLRAYKALLADPDFRAHRRAIRQRIARLYRRQGRYFRARRQFMHALCAHVNCLRFAFLETKGWRGLAASLLRRP